MQRNSRAAGGYKSRAICLVVEDMRVLLDLSWKRTATFVVVPAISGGEVKVCIGDLPYALTGVANIKNHRTPVETLWDLQDRVEAVVDAHAGPATWQYGQALACQAWLRSFRDNTIHDPQSRKPAEVELLMMVQTDLPNKAKEIVDFLNMMGAR